MRLSGNLRNSLQQCSSWYKTVSVLNKFNMLAIWNMRSYTLATPPWKSIFYYIRLTWIKNQTQSLLFQRWSYHLQNTPLDNISNWLTAKIISIELPDFIGIVLLTKSMLCKQTAINSVHKTHSLLKTHCLQYWILNIQMNHQTYPLWNQSHCQTNQFIAVFAWEHL